MLKEDRSFLITSRFIFAALFLVFVTTVCAQFGVRVPIKDAAKNPSYLGPKPTAARRSFVQKVSNRVITKTEIIRISNLSVTTEPLAKVELESLIKTAKKIKPIFADSKGRAIFDDLTPGNYRITASKDGFETLEQDSVEIFPRKPHVLNLALRPVTYKLRIETNLKGGEVRYAQAVNKRVDANGSIMATEIGNKCFVKIEKNGEAVVPDLKQGYYNLDIIPEALEYERTLVGVDVPEDAEQNDAGETKTFQIEVKTKISTETFGTAWTKEDWIMPLDWTLDKGMKVKNSAGIALPRNEQYRYYTNFQMISNVKLNDGGTVAFALRVVDAENYYRVQISGAKDPEPNVAKGYIVKNGEAKQIFSVSAAGFASTIALKSGFRIIIKGDEKGFKISIEDSVTGNVEAVGFMSDRDKTFQKGAVGIASTGKTNFEVSYFQVCPSECR